MAVSGDPGPSWALGLAVSDDVEPYVGRYDYDAAFAQNPDEPVFHIPRAVRECVYGLETVEECAARLRREGRETRPFPVTVG